MTRLPTLWLSEAQKDKGTFAAQAAKIPLAFCPPPNPFSNLIFQCPGGFKCADKKFFLRAILFYIGRGFFIHGHNPFSEHIFTYTILLKVEFVKRNFQKFIPFR